MSESDRTRYKLFHFYIYTDFTHIKSDRCKWAEREEANQCALMMLYYDSARDELSYFGICTDFTDTAARLTCT